MTESQIWGAGVIIAFLSFIIGGMFVDWKSQYQAEESYSATLSEKEIRVDERPQFVIHPSIQYSARRIPYILDCLQGKVFVIIQESSNVGMMAATGEECDRMQFMIDNNIR